MEFPEIGENCNEKSCKKLDFLPIKCDACSRIFCKDHVRYDSHNCTESYKKDNQVPTCPLCSKPIPIKPGDSADTQVSRHIDTDCQSDPAKERRGKVYTNKCSYKGCKQKELIPVSCDKCHKNFCLRHRHEQDHSCQGFQDSGNAITKAGAAAMNRIQNSFHKQSTSNNKRPQQTTLSGYGRSLDEERRARNAASSSNSQGVMDMRAIQQGMSDDEAMARAIQMSMAASTSQTTNDRPLTAQEEEDLALARALAESEAEARGQNQTQNSRSSGKKDSSCSMS